MQVAQILFVQGFSSAIAVWIFGVDGLQEFVERRRELCSEANAGNILNFLEPFLAVGFVVLEILSPRQRNFSGHFRLLICSCDEE
jgi:hypothetical protein